MAQFNIAVEHLFTLTLEGMGEKVHDYTGPFGRRVFTKASGGTVSGAALNGKVVPLLVTDYGRASADGAVKGLEASVVIQADDETIILMQYRGRAGAAYGPGQSRIQAMFQVEDGPYGWLNGVQAIGYGQDEGGALKFEVYALADGDGTEGAAEDGEPISRRSVPTEFLFRRKSEHEAGAKRHVIHAPLGSRYFTLAEKGGAFEGPRISGDFLPGYSWSPHRMTQMNGALLMQYDVQTLLETDDGVPVLMSYTGTSSPRYRPGSWRTAVQFEVAPGNHDWLNGVQAIGLGRWMGDGSEYRVFALR